MYGVEINQTYCADQFPIYRNTKSLYEMKIML